MCLLPKGKQVEHRGVSSCIPKSIGLSDKQNGTRSQFPKDEQDISVKLRHDHGCSSPYTEKLGIQDNG